MSDTLFQPLQNALSTFLSYLPQLIGAIVILIIGYIVAKVLQAGKPRPALTFTSARLPESPGRTMAWCWCSMQLPT